MNQPMKQQPRTGRRGRAASCPDAAAGPAAEFAKRLWQLKKSAGDPSYDRMRDEYGALASKSALSAAARGQHLPTWDTTWEFVRVLAVDVLGGETEQARREWRDAWDRARDAIDNSPDDPVTEAAETAEPAANRRRRWLVAAAAGRVVLACAAIVVGLRAFGAPDPIDAGAPALAPLLAGDASEYVRDVSVPDGTTVLTGTRFVKTWEIRNSGTVPWIDRYLTRSGSFGGTQDCRSAKRVPIPPTMPGESVRVSVEVRAPDEPGQCQVYWKMTDRQGRLLLPGQRGVYYLVEVID